MGQQEDYLEKGDKLLEQGKYDEALKSYNKAIEINPKNDWAWYSKGSALSKLKRFVEAVESFNKAIEINPESDFYRITLGDTLEDLERYKEALRSYDKAIELNPKGDWAWSSKGDVLQKLGNYSEAIESYNRAIEINPKGEWAELAWYSKGEILHKLEKYPEALESYNKTIKINPKRWLSWFARGYTLANLERSEEALESYNKAIEINPKGGLPFFVTGRLLFTQKKLPEALSNFKKASKLLAADGNTEGVRLANSWIRDLQIRIREERTQEEPPIEERIIRTIRENLQKIPDENPLKKMRDREKSYEEYFRKPRTITSEDNFLAVLRRWNSFTPKIPNRGEGKIGGGYFLVWKDKGIVIDPGFDFMDNFDEAGYSIRDIDAILMTHAHTDHTADLESMLNLLYELSDRVENEHKVDLFMNLGTVNKFIGWVSRVEGIGNKVSLNAGDSISPKGYGWTLNVKDARHDEIIGDDAVGLVFELREGSKPALKLGFTGDTGWNTIIQNQYRGCKLLILHLGSIGENEFDETLPLRGKKRRYNGHLGLIGTISMVKSLKPKLSVISEFGEELSTDKCHIAQCIDSAFGQNTRCLTGDTSLRIRLPDLAVHCNLCRNYQQCEDIQEMTIKAKEQVIYCCSSHTLQDAIDKLVV